MIKIHNEKVKKRKYSQLEKENIPPVKNDHIFQTKKKKVINNKYSVNNIIYPNIKPLTLNINNSNLLNNNINPKNDNKTSLLNNTFSKTSKKNESIINYNSKKVKIVPIRINKFDKSIKDQGQIKKRGVTVDTVSYKNKQNKINKTNSGPAKNNRTTSGASGEVTYCPRIFSSNIIKKVYL